MSIMRYCAACFFACLIFSSCQKDLSLDTGGSATGSGSGGTGGTGGGSTTSGNILVKVVTKQGIDSTVTSFGYNSVNSLTSYSFIGKASGITTDQRETYTRDAQNRVVQIMSINVIPSIPGIPIGGSIDTSYTNFFYNGTDTKVLYSKTISSQMGITYTDSVAYTYTGALISKTQLYIKVPLVGYSPGGETVYTYDANNNITNVKEYDVSGATPSVDTERKYTYDTKVNPLILGNEAVILSQEEHAGSNNVIASQIIDYVTGAGNLSGGINLVYRSNNTPASGSASVTQAGVTITGTSTYYYR